LVQHVGAQPRPFLGPEMVDGHQLVAWFASFQQQCVVLLVVAVYPHGPVAVPDLQGLCLSGGFPVWPGIPVVMAEKSTKLRHERDGSWQAIVTWVHQAGDRHERKLVYVAATSVQPLEAARAVPEGAAPGVGY
jgi:hypothetical protein